METNHVSSEDDLSACDRPLSEDRFFQLAVSCTSPERKTELLKHQYDQGERFLRKCMENNHVSTEGDPFFVKKASRDQDFQNAMRCISPERKKAFQNKWGSQCQQESLDVMNTFPRRLVRGVVWGAIFGEIAGLIILAHHLVSRTDFSYNALRFFTPFVLGGLAAGIALAVMGAFRKS